jgi:hypothetical protein
MNLTSGQDYPCPREGLRSALKDDKVFIYSEEHEIAKLNTSAGAIWSLCDKNHSISDISRIFEREQNLPEGALVVDVQQIIRQLRESGLLMQSQRVLEARQAVDWASVARPQEDLRDLFSALDLFAAHYDPDSIKKNDLDISRDALCGGRVRIRYCYETTSEDVQDAPFNHPNIKAAEAYLHFWSIGYRQFQAMIHSFHPVLRPGQPEDEKGFLEGSYCHSSDHPSMLGTMWSSVNCAMMLAENFVHETAHQKLFALGIRKETCDGLITNDPAKGYKSSVIIDRARPMTAVVHGVYAYLYVTQFDVKALRALRKDQHKFSELRNRVRTNMRRIEDGLEEIRRYITVDEEGTQFMKGFYDWADELIEEVCAELGGVRPPRSTNIRREDIASSERATHKVSQPAVSNGREPVRLYIGTDPQQRKAEQALEYSIRRYTKGPVEITWMDYSRGGLWADWKIGRDYNALPTSASRTAWATNFSAFRFAVPEAAGFRGRAIYLDSDMIVIRDLRDMFEQPMERPWLITPNCPAAMLIDCSWFQDKEWWPRVEVMKASGWLVGDYTGLLNKYGASGTLSKIWNCHDGKGFIADETGIIHFTTRERQPWMPYPEIFEYKPPESEDLWVLWWRMYIGALTDSVPTERPSLMEGHAALDREMER